MSVMGPCDSVDHGLRSLKKQMGNKNRRKFFTSRIRTILAQNNEDNHNFFEDEHFQHAHTHCFWIILIRDVPLNY